MTKLDTDVFSWAKNLPTDWDVKPLWATSTATSVKCTELDMLSVYLDKGVIPAKDGDLGTHAASLDLGSYQLVEPGDFVLNNQQAWRGSVGVSFLKGIISPAYIILKLKDELDWRYANYALRSNYMSDQYMLASRGVGSIQRQVHNKSLRTVAVLIPPLETQKRIADFLDAKTKTVDELIAKKEQLIELLKEKRAAIITQAVTKGLDQKVKLKPSDVEWLGEIPREWEIKPFRTLFQEKDIKNSNGLVQDVLSLSYGRVVDRDFDSNEGLLPASFNTYQIVSPGWIIFRFTDLQNDHKSLRTGLVKKRGIITSAYLAVEPSPKIISSYAAYLLHTYDLLKVFYRLGGGVRQSIGFDEVKWMPILLPDIEIQKSIVAHLDVETSQIDEVCSLVKSQIEKLKEYRSSLIYSAVTGKINVI